MLLLHIVATFVYLLLFILVCFLFLLFLLLVPFSMISYLFQYQTLDNPYSSSLLTKENILSHFHPTQDENQILEKWTNGIRDIRLQGKNEYTIFFVHGTNSIANYWIPIMKDFHELGYTVIAIDVPAFGISSKQSFSIEATPCETIMTYNQVFYQYFTENQFTKNTIIVAHSFGGFLMSNFVSKHPQFCSQLLLVNSAGLLPTLGENGAYWAIFFKLGLLSRPLRMLNGLITRIVYPLCRSLPLQKNILMLGNQESIGDHLVSQFITMRYTYSFWNRPMLQTLLQLKDVKVATVCGGEDYIIPSHLWMMLRSITNIPCYLLPEMGHCFSYTQCMYVAIQDCIQHLHEKEHHETHEIDLPVVLDEFQGCSYLYSHAKQIINELYYSLYKEEPIVMKIIRDQQIEEKEICKTKIL